MSSVPFKADPPIRLNCSVVFRPSISRAILVYQKTRVEAGPRASIHVSRLFSLCELGSFTRSLSLRREKNVRNVIQVRVIHADGAYMQLTNRGNIYFLI